MINQYGFSKSRPALSFIPPTMIIGALSYPLNRLLKRPECYQEYSGAERYRDIFVSINVKLPTFLSHYDLSRVLFMHRGMAEFDAVAVGKLYKVSRDPIEVITIVEESLAEKRIGDKWKDLLRAACFSITRIGARESIVTPLEIKEEGTPQPITDRRVVKTRFSFPSYSAKKIEEGTYITGSVIDWRKVNIGPYIGKEAVGYVVPTSQDGVKVELADGCHAYKCGEEVIISWR